jgi:hypothetical protein
MTFLARLAITSSRAELRARALETWRNAEELVAVLWRTYLAAERETRPAVFAAYLAALDAEAAAAENLARMSLHEAA